jgi:hypothetical protein
MFLRSHKGKLFEETILRDVRKFGELRIKRPMLLGSTILKWERPTAQDKNLHNARCISGFTLWFTGATVDILVPATEHGYFVASWWRTPLCHPIKVTRFYFQQTSGIYAPVRKRNGWSLSGRSPAPKADSFHVATMARKHSVLNLREINRNGTQTSLASVLTYYAWVTLIFWFHRCNERNII